MRTGYFAVLMDLHSNVVKSFWLNEYLPNIYMYDMEDIQIQSFGSTDVYGPVHNQVKYDFSRRDGQLIIYRRAS